MPSKHVNAIKRMFPKPSSWRIVRGDTVQVMVGKDRGKQGQVLRVVRDQRFPRVFVQGINMITRRVAAQSRGNAKTPGFSVRMEAPLHYSNVMLVDPLTKKPVRTYFLFEDQPPYKRVRKTRGRNATDSIIPWPQKWKDDLNKQSAAGEKDTRMEEVEEVTYDPASDFTLELPTEHTRLRAIGKEWEAAAKARAARKQQQWRGYNRLFFQSQLEGVSSSGGGGGGSSSGGGAAGRSGGRASAGSSSMRSFSSSSEASPTSSSSSVLPAQGGASLVWLLQRSWLCRSSASSRAGGVVAMVTPQQQQHMQRLSWCGLAAAPLLL